MNDWLGKHVGALPAIERVAASVRLTARCRQDATTAGIPLQEIRDAVGGNLIRKILQALTIASALQHEVSPAQEAKAETPAFAEG
jgi:hypothetical protein